MSMRKLQGTGTESVVERKVVDYLHSNPDIFVRHPELAAELQIPHSCGDAVSLVEYQVSALKSQNQQLRHKLKELIRNARDNEDLSQRLQRLTLALIDSETLEAAFSALYDALGESFQADQAVIRLFVPPRAPEDQRLGEFLPDDARAVQVFEHVLKADNPICGRLKQEQLLVLFGDEAGSIGSGVLMPLGVVERFGILAIGAHDRARFHPGMGTVFLRQLSQVAAHVIRPHLVVP